MTKLLIVEDDNSLGKLIVSSLEQHGFDVRSANDAESARLLLSEHLFACVILDLGLSGDDGLALSRDLVAQPGRRPFLVILNDPDRENERIAGLEAGADDCMTKPVSGRELVARVRALLRRWQWGQQPATPDSQDVLELGPWRLDTRRRELRHCTRGLVSLTGAELSILAVLMRSPGTVLSRDQILFAARRRVSTHLDRTVDVHIGRLRRKLGKDATIQTVRGVGYVLDGGSAHATAHPSSEAEKGGA